MDSLSPAVVDAPPRAFRDVRWHLSDVLIALAPLAAVRVFAAFVDAQSVATVPRWVWIGVEVVGTGWILGAPVWLARRRGATVPGLPRARSFLIESILALPLLLATWIALGIVVTVWQAIVGEPVRPRSPFEGAAPDHPGFLVLIALAVTVGPIGEETLFRGLMYNALRRRLTIVVAALLQGLAFGFGHSYGWVHGALAAALGVSLGLVYEWRKTLLTPIFMHVLHNAAAAAAAIVTTAAAANGPVLGVQGEPVDGGCRVTQGWPRTGAEAAGLRASDVISEVDGRRVYDIRDVAETIRQRRPGDVVPVEYVRNGARHVVEVKLGSRSGPRRE